MKKRESLGLFAFALAIFIFNLAIATADTTYYYRVGANNSYGISYSNTASVTITTCGNNSCDAGESCTSCPADCGICTDTTPPVLSNIRNSSITINSVLITWTTNENAVSKVYYGLTASFGETSPSGSSSTSHSFTLSNLVSDTPYYYKVQSCDTSGNCANSSTLSFKTLPNIDITAPTISNIINSSIKNISAIVSWQTNEDANGRVWYGTSAGTLNLNVFNSSYLPSRIINLNNLIANTTYYYKVQSCDTSGNCANSSTLSFKTLANNVTYVDNDGPLIYLNKPATEYSSSTKEVEFNYTVSDESLISNCTFYIGPQTRIDFNVTNGQDNVFVLTLENGDYVWNITCYDALSNKRESETRKLNVNYVAPPENPPGTSSSTGGTSSVIIKPKPVVANVTNITVPDQEKIILSDNLSYIDVDKDAEEKVFFDLYGNAYTMSFVLGENGSVIARLLNGNYLIPRNEVLPITVGRAEIYLGVVESNEESAKVAIGLDANAVREIVKGSGGSGGSSGGGGGGVKTIYYALMGVVAVLIVAIIVLVIWYFVKVRKEE